MGGSMERMTYERSNEIKFGYWSPHKRSDVVNQLGLYEDTGLTPADIEKLKEKLERKKE